MKIRYDKEIEVTKKQYLELVARFGGIIAHRTGNGRCFIKCWNTNCDRAIMKVIRKN